MSLVRARVEVRCKQWKIMTHCPNTECIQSVWRHIPPALPLQVDTLCSTLHLWCSGRCHRAEPNLALSCSPALKPPGTKQNQLDLSTKWDGNYSELQPFSNTPNLSWVTSLPPTLENTLTWAAALLAPLQAHPPHTCPSQLPSKGENGLPSQAHTRMPANLFPWGLPSPSDIYSTFESTH